MVGRSVIGIYSSGGAVYPKRQRVTGMALWLDATDTTSVHVAGGTSSVTTWEDLSGLSNHATFTSLLYSPVLASNAIGSSRAITFNGQCLELTNKQCMAGFAGLTYMVVFRLGGTVPQCNPVGNVGPDMNTPSLEYASSMNWSSHTYENIGTAARLDVGTYAALGIAANKTHLVTITGDTSDNTTYMYTNGTQVTTWAYGTAYRDYYWSVGRTNGRGSGSSSWYLIGGTIREIRIYDNRLSTSDLSDAHTKMKSKWGIT